MGVAAALLVVNRMVAAIANEVDEDLEGKEEDELRADDLLAAEEGVPDGNGAKVAVASEAPVDSAAAAEDTTVAPLEDKLEKRLDTPLASSVVVDAIVETGGGRV